MATYMIVLAAIKDRERFLADYASEAAKLVAQFGGRYVFRGTGAQQLEGQLSGDGRSVVISEWPNREAAERFWHSPEYAALKVVRENLCDAEVMLLEGQLS